MAMMETLIRQVAPRIPAWIRRPVKHLLRRAAVYGFSIPGADFGELPADFIGEQKVRIGHKELITARDFPEAGPFNWLDRPDAMAAVADRLREGTLTRDQADGCMQFSRDGFFVAAKLVPDNVIDAAIEAYVRGRSDGTLVNENGDRRYLNPHFKVPDVDALMRDPGILRWAALLLGRPTIPFQSIGSEWGSEQLEHADAIHMTTYPLGYLVAAWIACEDIHPDSGPLMYYPGSHKLPYYLSQEVGIGSTEFRERSYQCYAEKYEPFIQNLLQERLLTRRLLLAKKGDVLFWHHNLIHGGSPITNRALTRKAIVCHYFATGVFCYQDLTASRYPSERLR